MSTEYSAYDYDIHPIRSIRSSYDIDIKLFQVYVRDQSKWQKLLAQDDLRFFKHKKNLVKELKATVKRQHAILLKMSHWNSSKLSNDYHLSQQVTHPNFVKHLCYFEYEEDIVHLLMSNSPTLPEDINEENAVILSPYYPKILDVLKKDMNITDIVLQIVLSLYVALSKYNINYTSITIDNVYLETLPKKQKIDYEHHKIQTKYVIKIDGFANAGLCAPCAPCAPCASSCQPLYYRQFYNNIIQLLEGLNMQFLSGIIELVQSFVAHNDDNRVVNPAKIMDCLISNILINTSNHRW